MDIYKMSKTEKLTNKFSGKSEKSISHHIDKDTKIIILRCDQTYFRKNPQMGEIGSKFSNFFVPKNPQNILRLWVLAIQVIILK